MLAKLSPELPDEWEQVTDLVGHDLEAGWVVVQDLVRGATADEVLAYVAAGPLEDFLCSHTHRAIDRVLDLASRDAHFRRALSGVWARNRLPGDLRARIDSLLGDEERL
jgi:hypothetical protein